MKKTNIHKQFLYLDSHHVENQVHRHSNQVDIGHTGNLQCCKCSAGIHLLYYKIKIKETSAPNAYKTFFSVIQVNDIKLGLFGTMLI